MEAHRHTPQCTAVYEAWTPHLTDRMVRSEKEQDLAADYTDEPKCRHSLPYGVNQPYLSTTKEAHN